MVVVCRSLDGIGRDTFYIGCLKALIEHSLAKTVSHFWRVFCPVRSATQRQSVKSAMSLEMVWNHIMRPKSYGSRFCNNQLCEKTSPGSFFSPQHLLLPLESPIFVFPTRQTFAFVQFDNNCSMYSTQGVLQTGNTIFPQSHWIFRVAN